jgi:anti-anti-sigma factor
MISDRTFDVTITDAGGQVLVALAGDLDIDGRDRFHDAFAQLEPITKPIVLDVSRVAFVDSSGLGCLCYARNALYERIGRPPTLTGATPGLRRLLAMSGIEDMFEWSEPGGSPN